MLDLFFCMKYFIWYVLGEIELICVKSFFFKKLKEKLCYYKKILYDFRR